MNTTSKMQLQCPMPKFDFEIITLGHGSGGVLTSKLLDEMILSQFSNDLLDKKHDGAIIPIEKGRLAFSTDSFVVSPLFFPGGNIGDLAINGTVNDLAMCGAMPKYLSLSFIIEEGLKVTDFWQVIQSLKKAAEVAGIQIVTGDTKVVEKGKGDQLFINTSGIGLVHEKANIDAQRIEIGDKIIVSNSIAHHGMAIMSVREGLQFESEIKSDSCAVNYIITELLDQFGDKIKLLRDPTRGGVATVLNEIAEDINKGVFIEESKIIIDENVAGACELMGLDPLFVANEGVFIAIISPEIETEALAIIQKHEKAQKAFCIGSIVTENPKKVVIQSEMGGKRMISKLIGEQLPRIC